MLWVPIVAVSTVALAASAGSGRAVGSATTRATAVTTGISHTCALTSDGGVKCWGYNGHDELGHEGPDSSTPVDVPGLATGLTAISAGTRHSCALTRGGGVKCWGVNYSGALGDGTSDRHPTPVDVVGLSSGVTVVSAGYEHNCAVMGTGGVKCWGWNDHGQLGDGTTDDRFTPVDVVGLSSGVSSVDVGIYRSCALTTAGGVKCWGINYGPTPVDVPGLSGGVTAITDRCALTSAGAVKCWAGEQRAVPADVPGLSSGVTAIATGASNSCALTSVGGVKCWGLNDYGQLGDGTSRDSSTPVDVSGLSRGATAIAAGGLHACAVVRTGGIRCWGANGAGELGDGTTVNRPRPVDVLGFGVRAKLAIVSSAVRVTPERVAALKLRCGSQTRCRGTLTLTASVNGKIASRSDDIQLKLGGRSVSIDAGHAQVVNVKLTVRGFKLLVRMKRTSGRGRVRYKQPAGGTTLAIRTITLIAPKL